MRIGAIWRGRRLLGVQSAGVWVLAVLMTAFAATFFDPGKWASRSDAQSGAVAAGVLFSVAYMAATARMFVRGHNLYVVSALRTFVVDLGQIKDVDDENGLFLRLTDDREVGSMAFGSSLIATLTGNRRC